MESGPAGGVSCRAKALPPLPDAGRAAATASTLAVLHVVRDEALNYPAEATPNPILIESV